MQRIISNKAPDAIGPYIHATESNGLIFTSGQIGLDPKTNQLVDGFENQTKQALTNLQNVLETADSDFDHVLKTTIYLADINDFAKINDIYKGYFNDSYPARTAFEVANLPINALIEIEAIAETNK
ncbi:RidA family protein [Companilactobacillus nantensis]|uniref:Uncharacterized protein n=1 Tax=Companilactobacillus nantensis DSM 16982 TaxID=1423774 RepID=A0A0R1WCV2_9LACO|nr:Rid family detoxifying hydrolase [Companilactobacillus nantensis]KRM15774.1 hypothetical protein FD31_GL000872 [Companilactobacillus nantensis DSM 16982]GEO64556.1 reactive intermediate/imine deaminase [Companilactobacillus nantensis]